MISLINACLSLGSKTLLNGVSCTISNEVKLGLVGSNGAGKSTLLRVIAGQQPLDSGSVSIASAYTLAYVAQNESFSSERTVLQQVKTAYSDFVRLTGIKKEIEAAIDTETVSEEQLEQYAHLCTQLAQFDAGAIEDAARRVLYGLGFSDERIAMPVNQLSVGWAMRVYLAQLLLSNADFYLFDEPTNHLDIACCRWFIDYLQNASFGFMLVSHDRHVLNAVCERTCEIESGSLTFYMGNYDAYIVAKQERIERLRRARSQQQKEIAHKKRLIERFRASATKARMAQGLIRELEQMEIIKVPPNPAEVSFSFPTPERSARVVMQVANVSYAFGDTLLFQSVTFEIERGWRVALVAPNGVGKSTLLRLIVGDLPLQSGSVTMGDRVRIGYFDQDQAAALDGARTILQNVVDHTPVGQQRARTVLGSFLFPGDDVDKPVAVLSGGEKNRVGMVQVLLQGTNLLILDEPTNHLDLASKAVLLKALQSYQGTILFVSHDAYFVNALATHVLELTHEGARLFHGNYDDYCVHEGLSVAIQQYDQDVPTTTPGAQSITDKKAAINRQSGVIRNRLLKRVRSVEQKIASIEQKLEQHSVELAKQKYGTPAFANCAQMIADLQSTLQDLHTQWERVQHELDQL